MVQEKLRAVFYARVSTAEEEQLKALPKQVEECKDVIASKGWKLVDGYVDEGKSGTKTDGRKAYKKLLEDMQQDKFEIVVVKSQDRLQRNTFDWYRFTDLLNKNGKQLFLYIDNKFYEPSEDALITGIKAILAEEYSRDLSKKLNNANKRRIEKAKAGGAVSAMGNSQMYGYRIIDGKWVIEPDEAKVVKKMYELYLELGSIKKVRDAMNEQGYRNKVGKLFTDEGVGRILKNEKHKGWVILNKYHRNFETKKIDEFPEKEWVIVKDDHEPIVSEELWDKVNDTIKSHLNKGHEKAKGKKFGNDPLSGKIFCSCCGKVLYKHTSIGSYRSASGKRVKTYKHYHQWYCSSKIARGEMACSEPATISGVQINKYLVELADCFLDYSTIEYSKNLLKKRSIDWLKNLKIQLSVSNDNKSIEEEILKLENKKGKLIDLYTDELITKEEFMVKSNELETNLEKKKALLVPVEHNPDIEAIEDTIKNIDAEIESLFDDEAMVMEKKIQFITEHIKKVVVFGNRDVFIVLDTMAGAFLFLDKEDARIEIVPMEEYNASELSEVGITEKDFVPFDRESMQINSKRERIYIQSKGTWLRGSVFD